jgi:hypothetical protein
VLGKWTLMGRAARHGSSRAHEELAEHHEMGLQVSGSPSLMERGGWARGVRRRLVRRRCARGPLSLARGMYWRDDMIRRMERVMMSSARSLGVIRVLYAGW